MTKTKGKKYSVDGGKERISKWRRFVERLKGKKTTSTTSSQYDEIAKSVLHEFTTWPVRCEPASNNVLRQQYRKSLSSAFDDQTQKIQNEEFQRQMECRQKMLQERKEEIRRILDQEIQIEVKSNLIEVDEKEPVKEKLLQQRRQVLQDDDSVLDMLKFKSSWWKSDIETIGEVGFSSMESENHQQLTADVTTIQMTPHMENVGATESSDELSSPLFTNTATMRERLEIRLALKSSDEQQENNVNASETMIDGESEISQKQLDMASSTLHKISNIPTQSTSVCSSTVIQGRGSIFQKVAEKQELPILTAEKDQSGEQTPKQLRSKYWYTVRHRPSPFISKMCQIFDSKDRFKSSAEGGEIKPWLKVQGTCQFSNDHPSSGIKTSNVKHIYKDSNRVCAKSKYESFADIPSSILCKLCSSHM